MMGNVLAPYSGFNLQGGYPQGTDPETYGTVQLPSPTGLYSITGTGFGTKTGTPYYEDFESETIGAASFPVGSLLANNGGSATISSISNSGTKSLHNDFGSEGFPEVHKLLSGTNRRGYQAVIFKFTGAGGTVWKHSRFGAGVVYHGDPKVSESWTSTLGSTSPDAGGGSEMKTKSPAEFTGFDANSTAADKADYEAAYPTDTWLFHEMELDAGTLGNADSYLKVNVNNKEILLWDGLQFLDVTAPGLPDWALTVMNGQDGASELQMYMDSVYIDESRARCVMTDNAVYASSSAGKKAIQPIATYADTAVTCTRKRQQFAVGEIAFLHLFDNDGVLVDSGSAFLVSEDL